MGLENVQAGPRLLREEQAQCPALVVDLQVAQHAPLTGHLHLVQTREWGKGAPQELVGAAPAHSGLVRMGPSWGRSLPLSLGYEHILQEVGFQGIGDTCEVLRAFLSALKQAAPV